MEEILEGFGDWVVERDCKQVVEVWKVVSWMIGVGQRNGYLKEYRY